MMPSDESLEEAARQEALTGPEIERAVEHEIGTWPAVEQPRLWQLLRAGKLDVRRSAYRTMASLDDHKLLVVCEGGRWHADEDARKRAEQTLFGLW